VNGTFWIRLPWTFLLLTISWGVLGCGVYFAEGRLSTATMLGLGIVWFYGFAISFIPLKLAAWLFRWRITWDGMTKRDNQSFAIRDLMIGTGLLAVTFALGRQMIPGEIPSLQKILQGSNLDQPDMFFILAVFGVFSLIVKLPCIWIALATQKERMVRHAVVWMVISGAMGFLELFTLSEVIGPPSPREYLEVMLYLVLSHMAMAGVIMGVLFLLRYFGYRLERTKKLNRAST